MFADDGSDEQYDEADAAVAGTEYQDDGRGDQADGGVDQHVTQATARDHRSLS